MAKNLFSLKDIKNKPHRDGFDLSFRNVFSAPLGQLIPVVNKMCFPGDSFKVNVNWFTRTQPCTSPAFTRFTEYYDFFFVPLHFLWRNAPQYFSQTNADNFIQNLPQSQEGILDPTMFKEMPNIDSDLVKTYLTSCTIGQLGTASLKPRTEAYAKAYDECGYPRAYGTQRLLESLNYGLGIMISPSDASNHLPEFEYIQKPNTAMSIMPLLAYQKIYNDFYRNSQWEKPTPSSFNVDYFQTSSDLQGINQLSFRKVGSSYFFGRTIFDIAYADFAKDYFTGVLPNKQFGDTALAAPLVSTGNSNLAYYNSHTVGGIHYHSLLLSTQEPHTTIKTTSSFPLGISALSIRQAEFLQKWKEITQSGGTDYVSQMQKHFGVTPSKELSHKVTYLGGVTKRFGIDEVVNTNITGNNQANIAGKGLNVGDGTINFKCSEHGIFMCIYHVGVSPEYDSYSDKELFKIRPEDYLIPEFDNIGMQDVRNYEYLTDNTYQGAAVQNQIFGYVPRYSEYKTSVDQIHGVFRDTLKNWVTPINRQLNLNLNSITTDLSPSTNYINFKMSPRVLNNVFGVSFDGSYPTDQFLVNADFDIKAVRNVSRNGLPY